MSSEPAPTTDELKELTGAFRSERSDRVTAGKSCATVLDGFRLADSGVWLAGEEDKPDIWIGARLEVVGLTRDRHNESWGRLLEWRDADGRLHTWAMPATFLAGDGGELRAKLLDGGLTLSPGRKAREGLIRYLSESQAAVRTRCTTRTGWHGESFVLPDLTIGPDQEEVIYQNDGESLLRQSGTLDEWKGSRRSRLHAGKRHGEKPEPGRGRTAPKINLAVALPVRR